MLIAKATEKMIRFYEGNLHDICHFLKVLGYARTIGQLEKADAQTQKILELSAIAHDIACPLCRSRYGSANGADQEREGIPMTLEFYAEFDLTEAERSRICYLVGHHHTLTNVEGMDYQILLEADFLVNADEGNMPKEAIIAFRDRVFRTKTGTALLNDIYGL